MVKFGVGFLRKIERFRILLKSRKEYWNFVSSIRPSDVFIVSFPKSGTTWLTFLISNILKKGSRDLITLRNTVNVIPDVNKLYLKKKGHLEGASGDFSALPNPRLFRVHSPYDPKLPNVLYLLRDPRATMLSYWHYERLAKGSFDLSLKDFLNLDNHWPCSWDQHVLGWLSANQNQRILIIKYEALHTDTAGVLRHVLNFCNIHYDERSLGRAIEASTFERMRYLEETYGNAERRNHGGEHFIRQGQPDGWKDELDRESLKIVEERYGSVMRSCGYDLATRC